MKDNLAKVGALIAFATAMIWAGTYGLAKEYRVECLRWQKEARIFPQYYLTADQKAQCDALEIEVAAPVRTGE